MSAMDAVDEETELDLRPAIFPIGTLIGERYEIRAILGRGAMGQVFEAFDLSLGRRVALKAHWRSVPVSLEPEARALAAIRHPSVVTVHDFGRHDGAPFMVMELVSGTPWSKMLERVRASGGLPTIAETLGILRAVAGGLAAVHEAGIAHGDVKPGNVLLAMNRVILTDLGLVHIESAPERLRGIVAGTPSYVAPELVLGEKRAGHAHLVDIYAFGVTAFEALSGRTPFDAEHTIQLFAMHVDAPIPRVTDLRSDMPAALADLVAQCMAKDPLERPASMHEVLFRIDALRTRMTARDPLEVLVADDDDDIARLLVAGVREAVPDAHVRVVHDGPAAIAACQSRRPHVLLLDMMMPGMSGLEVLGYLRGTGLADDCDVLFVSASANAADRALVASLGARAFVTKGEGLRRNVRDALRGVVGAESARPAQS